jgi:menaquinone-9 beta-reductase
MTPIPSTLTPDQALHLPWDVIVLGAGPAGASAAITASRSGLKTLLLDKATFPRDKVCGGCLNQSSLQSLSHLGLPNLPGALPIHHMTWASHRKSATFSLPQGLALSRRSLDAAMITHAVQSGASFLSGVSAHVTHPGQVTLPSLTQPLLANVVVLADGLKGSALPSTDLLVQDDAHLGAGALVPAPPGQFAPHTIFMATGPQGYVGLVRVEDGLLNIAAALSPAFVRSSQGINNAISNLLSTSGLPLPNLTNTKFLAVGNLTRTRTQLWRPRTLIIGDAAGYVEPFTGEGMAWAMSAGIALKPYLHAAQTTWSDTIGQSWQKHHARSIASRQRLCRTIAWSLRRPWLVSASIGAVNLCPWLAAPFTRHINTPAPLQGSLS